MLRLKESTSHAEFLKHVMDCRGEVLFITAEGDTLNLKSTLSQFVFAASFLKPEIVQAAQVKCEDAGDYGFLKDFLEEPEAQHG